VLHIYDISSLKVNDLTLILLTWRKWWTPNNASKWQMGFNSAFKGLKLINRRQDITAWSLRFPQRCCWCSLEGFAEGSCCGVVVVSYRRLLKVSRWDCRRFLQRRCWRIIEGFAEGSCSGAAEYFYESLQKFPTAVLLKVSTGVCWRSLQRCCLSILSVDA